MSKDVEAEALDNSVDFSEPTPAPQPTADAAAAPAGSSTADTDETADATADENAPAKPSRFAALAGNLPLAIASLAVFTSLVATVGLLMASRNMALANERIAALEAAVRQNAPASAQPGEAQPASAGHGKADASAAVAAANPVELRAALDDFRRDLVAYQATGSNAQWFDAVRDGQAELANRINSITEKVDRIDRRLNGSRPASSADDRARPF
ncbi:hypothetical protein SAMN06295912_11926 [Sphingomonas laterariae]|uniref:Uncharacterized protein n=1 Tax=Edaphosphingomonas laterariae TaxID=861865 RepID=A0A239HTP6_9SPHN|nr:hypothetical protein [Sphingomonas laterariae]SNS84669.1 hypothetical protein SAMN06295912_11926 [Sphingomonas laterariae]